MGDTRPISSAMGALRIGIISHDPCAYQLRFRFFRIEPGERWRGDWRSYVQSRIERILICTEEVSWPKYAKLSSPPPDWGRGSIPLPRPFPRRCSPWWVAMG